MKKLELLAPARNLACGVAAVNHGADAVYIGAHSFSARASASNSLSDIASLIQYAHLYKVKVYVAINTILSDSQLSDAEKLIHEVYNIGADAIIIQDMGILKMNLPPIALHASTQTNNQTLQKVQFLQQSGFSRVVLARELELHQIRQIAANTSIEIEAFIHGALCVSYSGQCYISCATTGRSANRGACAQICRLPFEVIDSLGNTLEHNKHVLSLKDLDASNHLEHLVEAGVTSFKIEGRLKQMDYVKNITAYYRQKMDHLMEEKASTTPFKRASLGKTRFYFEPDPQKTFRRDATSFFLHGRQRGLNQPDSPKSVGAPAAVVKGVFNHYIQIDAQMQFQNGDGVSFFNENGDLEGFRVNRVENDRLYPAHKLTVQIGTRLFKNHDKQFDDRIAGKSAERKMALNMRFGESDAGFYLHIEDEEGMAVRHEVAFEKQLASQADNVIQNITLQLSKLGNTVFEVQKLDIELQQPWFLPVSLLNQIRRETIIQLEDKRQQAYQRPLPAIKQPALYPEENVSYLANITNRLAQQFYTEHGVKRMELGFERKKREGVALMFCKFCIKYEKGYCPREGNSSDQNEPWYLRHKQLQFRVQFDCAICEMRIYQADS